MDKKMNSRVMFGWLATAIWIVSWAALLYYGWESAMEMNFNEWGDFFAGAFAPLAFLWLVIGYFQQGEELGQNTKALEQQERALQLQVNELKQSVEQQNRSAIALSQQSAISGLMAKLEATNRIMDSTDRQIKRAEESNSANASKNIKELLEKQTELEHSIEQLLTEIENVEKTHNGHE
jgi:hypothetical protein